MRLRTILKRKIILEIIYGLFILLFLYTAVSKLSNRDGFESVISRSPLIKNNAPIVSWGVPLLELVIVVSLLLPKLRHIGLWLSTALMVLFTGYLFYIIYFTPELPCSCGGVLRYLTWKQHLVFNLFFTALGIWGIWLNKPTKNNDQAIQHQISISA